MFPRLRVGLPNSLLSELVARRVSEGARRASRDCRRIPHAHLAAAALDLKQDKERTMATLMHDTAHEEKHGTAHERTMISSQLEAVGRELARYGLVVVLAWIGLMKFT